MNIVETLKAQVRPEMNPELSWAIIVLFAGVIIWVAVRYVNRLDTMIDRISVAIENIGKTLVDHANSIRENTEDIKDLQKKRRP